MIPPQMTTDDKTVIY